MLEELHPDVPAHAKLHCQNACKPEHSLTVPLSVRCEVAVLQLLMVCHRRRPHVVHHEYDVLHGRPVGERLVVRHVDPEDQLEVLEAHEAHQRVVVADVADRDVEVHAHPLQGRNAVS